MGSVEIIKRIKSFRKQKKENKIKEELKGNPGDQKQKSETKKDR